MMRPQTGRRQRGVALITAVLIVALAVILATQIGFDSALEQRRSATVLTLDQAFLVGLGAEAWAASYLKDNLDGGATQDTLAQKWATPMPPIPIDGGQIEGRLEDLQGRLNLNNLVNSDGTVNEEWVRVFRNLLTALQLEPKWADLLADWLDADTDPRPDGAEDNVYTTLTPPYRAANSPITSVSELLALPDFGLKRYRRLKPFVAALPSGTPINLCTASGVVIDALSDGLQEFSLLSPDELAHRREQNCFPSVNEFKNRFAPGVVQQLNLDPKISEKTSYFRLTSIVTIGSTQLTLYSLLQRDPGSHRVLPVMRSFGTE
jgi:general secretion pathway protein K